MSTQISIRNYGNYSSENYGAHCQEVSIGSLTLYFSYKTVIAFLENGKLTIRQNDWSTTTGKHLNSINPDKKIRINGYQFEIELSAMLKRHNIAL